MLTRFLSLTAAACVSLGLTCGVSIGGVIFSVDHNNLPAVGEPVITWDNFTKTGGTPVVVDLGGEKWYENHQPTADKMRENTGAFEAPIPINGATIVTAIKPIRGDGGNPWNSVVDIFYDQLCIGVNNETGQVKVKVSGANAGNPIWTSTEVLPEEAGVLSLSVDNTGAFEVFWRGQSDAATISIGTGTGNTAGEPYTALYPGANDRGYAKYMNLGRNDPDGWTTYNGLIGDTIVYDEQLSPAALEAQQDAIREAMGLGGPAVPTVKQREWNVDSLGDWTDSENWTAGGAPDGGNYAVTFGSKITADATVVTDADVTVKDISFENANRYAIAGTGSVTLQDTFDEDPTPVDFATIEVAQGTHEFQLPVTLGSPTEVGVIEAADELIFNNALNLGGFQLEKVGDGKMSINNILATGGGSILVTEGTLGGNGTVGGNLVVNATVAPGNSIGELSVTGDANIAAGGVLRCELQGTAGDSDTLAVDGTLTVTGDVQLDWLPSAGDAGSLFGGTYTLATYASLSGTPALGAGGNIGSAYVKTALADTGTALEVTLHNQGLGDTDLDADIDGDDLATFGLAWSPSSTDKSWFDGDFDFDGDIDGDDLAALGLAWAPGGIDFPAGEIEVTAVPEPGTAVMLLICAAGMLLYRKRR